jgi:ABC-type sugar transport system ATPase subunit
VLGLDRRGLDHRPAQGPVEQTEAAFRLEGITFDIPPGAYGVLMGPTGCGKTTILEAVCGLRRIERGRIVLPLGDATRWRPAERNVGYVPQDGVLFPSMTVAEHLAFSLVVRRWREQEIDKRVRELAGLLQIEHLLDRRPVGMSGGERQRIALGRALAFRPAVLCLDEPLSALDHDTREQMYGLLQDVRHQAPVTVLHVTHSPTDARRLADIVLRLRHGKIVPS